ncbi:hypothetical protein ECANGB1_2081 [Enterospora canceri]|uniref:Uncharacterized protein n=1 Tax=Enterospora canceri TaxID=1081671 RepID=A0A1Y1S8S9_9MICR|nr:hypothetical protein ECANGB1_2081 [Enterospora canceri]
MRNFIKIKLKTTPLKLVNYKINYRHIGFTYNNYLTETALENNKTSDFYNNTKEYEGLGINSAANEHMVIYIMKRTFTVDIIERYENTFIKKRFQLDRIKGQYKIILSGKTAYFIARRFIAIYRKEAEKITRYFDLFEFKKTIGDFSDLVGFIEKPKSKQDKELTIRDAWYEYGRLYILINWMVVVHKDGEVEQIYAFNKVVENLFITGRFLFLKKRIGLYKIDLVELENTDLILLDFDSLVDLKIINNTIYMVGYNELSRISMAGDVNTIKLFSLIKHKVSYMQSNDTNIILYDSKNGYIKINIGIFDEMYDDTWEYIRMDEELYGVIGYRNELILIYKDRIVIKKDTEGECNTSCREVDQAWYQKITEKPISNNNATIPFSEILCDDQEIRIKLTDLLNISIEENWNEREVVEKVMKTVDRRVKICKSDKIGNETVIYFDDLEIVRLNGFYTEQACEWFSKKYKDECEKNLENNLYLKYDRNAVYDQIVKQYETEMARKVKVAVKPTKKHIKPKKKKSGF